MKAEHKENLMNEEQLYKNQTVSVSLQTTL